MATAAETLQSHLEFVLDERVGPLSRDQRRFLDVACRHGRRLLALVEDLRTVALAEAGELELEWSLCDAETMFGAAIEKVWPVAHVGQTPIDVSVAGPVWFNADAERLLRALTELMEQVVEEARRGTPIRIELAGEPRRVQIAYEADARAGEQSLALSLVDSLLRLQGGGLDVLVEGDTVLLTLVLAGDEALLRVVPEAA